MATDKTRAELRAELDTRCLERGVDSAVLMSDLRLIKQVYTDDAEIAAPGEEREYLLGPI